jgi:1-acyl-sn-glycerol-3-phosphate acyltransferase
MKRESSEKNKISSFFFYLIFGIYQWVFLFPFIFAITLFIGTAIILNSYITRSKWFSHTLATWWAKQILLFSFVKLECNGIGNIDKNQSYVIVANHISAYDIFIGYSCLKYHFIFIIKKEIRKVPFFGLLCERLGHIYVDRSNGKQALLSLNKAKHSIKNGTSILFFPEGTRSKTGELGNFKSGAFRMAHELNIPILPITISGTREILKPNSLKIRPGKVKVVIHKAINTTNFKCNENAIQNLMHAAKESILNDV